MEKEPPEALRTSVQVAPFAGVYVYPIVPEKLPGVVPSRALDGLPPTGGSVYGLSQDDPLL